MNATRFLRLKAVLERRQPDLTVLMEQVNKPHNFSAILRNCDAVGALDAHVVLPEKGIDLHHHTSAGTSKWVRVQVHETTREAADHLKKSGYRLLAAHPAGGARDYRRVDLTLPTAFVVGAELDGLSEDGLALADDLVMIPMAGMVRSLNVSVATALLLFEAFRQRQDAGFYDAPRVPPDRLEKVLFEWCHPDLAAVLRARGEPYPPLDEDGEPLR